MANNLQVVHLFAGVVIAKCRVDPGRRSRPCGHEMAEPSPWDAVRSYHHQYNRSPITEYSSGSSSRSGLQWIGSCPHYLQTCCKRSATARVQPPPAVTGGCGWSNPGAGIFRTKDSENINRKTYADYGEYPWMVAVMRTTNNVEAVDFKQSDYIGGGAIIHPSVVITIAHKVEWQSSSQTQSSTLVL
ncbi:hypothetical protein RR46_01112 [Papilio xuthus]|uniref:Peptidase S1 domain-containing protein n=1 Tax=Papilio xuthus TaxID=66420 RepID=A0A0N1PE24_PAPXU|nr:hypothetical protein RR46_01112 [Papilio xuthus]